MLDGFIVKYFFGLLVVALVLFGLYAAVRSFGARRFIANDRRLISVIDSAFVSQNATVHVVRIGAKYFALGGGSGPLRVLCEVPGEDVRPWLQRERELLAGHARSARSLVAFLRRKPRI